MATTLERKRTEYNGCQIDHLVEVEAKGVTATVNEAEKLEYVDGRVAVDWVSNSYRYGNEIQIIFYTKRKPEKRPRVDGHGDWQRVEFHFTLDEFAKLVKGVKF